MKERLVIVGLDGATWTRLGPLIDEGVCPSLGRLARCGFAGTLHSCQPPLSPPAWATMMTGVNAGKHGVFDFYYRPRGEDRGYGRRVVGSAEWRSPALWEHASHRGLGVGVIAMPMCYPPPRVRGFFVSGLGTPAEDCDYTEPPALKGELRRALGRYVVECGDGTTYGSPRAFLTRCREAGDSMLAASRYLWRRNDLDLFITVLVYPDRFQHFFWRYLDPEDPRHEPWPEAVEEYRRWFAAADAFVGELARAVETWGGTLLVVSDHGFGRVERYFYVNRWLERQGYLALRPGAIDRGCGLLEAIDWSRTRAYSLCEYGELRLNLRGRDPCGIVSPGTQAEELCRELTWRLKELRDPRDGLPVVDWVRRGRDVYCGPWAGEAPDLVFTLRGCSYLAYVSGRGKEFREQGEVFSFPAGREHYSGGHRVEGVCLAYGPAVRRGAFSPQLTLADIAPTSLYLLGVPVDPAMEGRVAAELLDPDYLTAHPLRWMPVDGAAGGASSEEGYTPEEEALVTARLEALGYVG